MEGKRGSRHPPLPPPPRAWPPPLSPLQRHRRPPPPPEASGAVSTMNAPGSFRNSFTCGLPHPRVSSIATELPCNVRLGTQQCPMLNCCRLTLCCSMAVNSSTVAHAICLMTYARDYRSRGRSAQSKRQAGLPRTLCSNEAHSGASSAQQLPTGGRKDKPAAMPAHTPQHPMATAEMCAVRVRLPSENAYLLGQREVVVGGHRDREHVSCSR